MICLTSESSVLLVIRSEKAALFWDISLNPCDFLLGNKKEGVLKNVLAVLSHTVQMNGQQSFQALRRMQKHHKSGSYDLCAVLQLV